MRTLRFLHSFLCSLFLVFIISACSEDSSTEDELIQVSDDFTSYDLIKETPTMRLSDLIESIEITRLEETDESLLGNVVSYYSDDEQVVFESGKEGDIYVFSSEGMLVNRINRKGEGPEEYTSIQDIWVENDSLVLYTKGKHLKWYDLEGNFLKVEDVAIDAGHLLPYKDGYATDVSFAFIQDSLRYNFAFTDNDFRVQAMHQKAGPMPNMQIFTSSNSLQAYKDLVLYQRMISDTIYSFSGEEFRPFIHFDLGEEWAFAEGEEFSDGVFSNAISSGKAWNVVSMVNERLVFMYTYGGETGKNRYLIDRVSGKKVRIDTSIPNAEEVLSVSVSHWQDDLLLGSISSLSVSPLLDQLEESQYEFTERTTLEEIESSENPALVKIKFKDSSEW